MKKHFFSHLIEIDTLHVRLDELELNEEQKEELKKLMDENIYHTVLEAILSELSEDDKRVFLAHLVADDHGKIWEYVNTKIENIESKIVKAAEDIKNELHDDIGKTKRRE